MTTEMRKALASVAVVGFVFLLVGCTPAPADDDMGDMSGEQTPGGVERGSGVDIAFSMTPDPPVAGENTFAAMVMDADGQAVTDATVSVQFYMAAMPAMNMPEMQNTTTLAHQRNGRYEGTGQVIMAGDWDVTITAARDGEEIGRRELRLTAAP